MIDLFWLAIVSRFISIRSAPRWIQMGQTNALKDQWTYSTALYPTVLFNQINPSELFLQMIILEETDKSNNPSRRSLMAERIVVVVVHRGNWKRWNRVRRFRSLWKDCVTQTSNQLREFYYVWFNWLTIVTSIGIFAICVVTKIQCDGDRRSLWRNARRWPRCTFCVSPASAINACSMIIVSSAKNNRRPIRYAIRQRIEDSYWRNPNKQSTYLFSLLERTPVTFAHSLM